VTAFSQSVTGAASLLGPARVVFSIVAAAAILGFANRFRVLGEDLDRWLAFGATLMLFASLDDIFTPRVGTTHVSQGDFLRLLGYGVLLVGVWRAIRASEFGRAVAEERARVAREIHDGLAQYLFAVSTHVSLLEAGADPAKTVPRLKEAALAAQREARFAVLALSSAAGNAPFDAALRRYVDILTADGAFEVEVEIDPGVRLAPDEQIEIFRIVQEGLANARRHAGARRAWVTVGQRGADRLVAVRDDGSGFDSNRERDSGQGLRNIRERAASIGGALSLASAPGLGTALEVVLRA
jgi:signal transduction histidine kinase